MYKPWNVVAGLSIVVMMVLTTADVVFRIFGKPIFGIYDLVGILGAIAYAAALPDTTAQKRHVAVQLFIQRLPSKPRIVVNTITTCFSIALFGLIAWYSRLAGIDLREAGRVTPDLELPYQHILYLIALASFFVCLTLVRELLKSFRDHTEG